MYQNERTSANPRYSQPFYHYDRLQARYVPESVVYLLHFERRICPTHPCQHYMGWTNNLYQRLDDHRAGIGARLTQVAVERDIPFRVVRTWAGDRAFERVLKALKNGRKLCPICMGTAPWLDACTVPDGDIPF